MVCCENGDSRRTTAAVFGAVAEFGDKLSPFVAIVASVDRALTVQRWSSYAN